MNKTITLDSYRTEQLQSAITQLDRALYHHEQWYKNVLRVLILHLPAEIGDLSPDAHRHCRFGQWYDGLSAQFLQEHSTFSSLGPVHEKMHECARTLLQKVSDDLPVEAEDFDLFNNLLDRLRLEFQALKKELVEKVQNRDPLTGARNRTMLLSELREQQALVSRGIQSTALAMFDLDHFKHINDDYGHIAGDMVLIAIVKCIQALIRPYDRLYRYGGEEFLICMPGMTLQQATDAAERMRDAVEKLDITDAHAEQVIHITTSIGVSILMPERSVEDTLDSADTAMYAAKTSGRNRVMSEEQ